ncbi:MAG: hypothetical protein L6Q37_15640 [Bdellovibrionaceae bacterium]|nr:hypothetical protein [Pseudobdellovibrionaceae bacterium]NUM59878.1 hypothetical protein [Pseudobdellovibrionaceae bacterium]
MKLWVPKKIFSDLTLLVVVFIFPFLSGAHPFLPHHVPEQGPWFEGWYVRVTDNISHRSFAVIGASELKPNQNSKNLSGYLSVLIQDGQGRPTKSIESFPKKTALQRYSKLGMEEEGFVWSAAEQGHITDQGIDVSIGDQVEVKASFKENNRHWNPYWNSWGPEGFGTFIKLIPLHWFVHSLDSSTVYQLKYKNEDGQVVERKSIGSAHIEKNWGKTFPKAWMWLQGYDVQSGSSLALAGGILSLGPFNVKTYLVGYKSKNINADFQVGQLFDVSFQDKIDPCHGQYALEASNGEYLMKLKANADPKSFGSVSIPTENGYKSHGGMESFSAEIDVEIYQNSWIQKSFQKKLLIEKIKITKAALEFGAEYMKCEK